LFLAAAKDTKVQQLQSDETIVTSDSDFRVFGVFRGLILRLVTYCNLKSGNSSYVRGRPDRRVQSVPLVKAIAHLNTLSNSRNCDGQKSAKADQATDQYWGFEKKRSCASPHNTNRPADNQTVVKPFQQ